MAEFDPYLKWLGIREDTRPLEHYTLLGIERFEDDQDVIVSSADRQMAHIRSFQTGARGAIAQQVLNQLARARRCLITEEKKKAYDQQLRAQLKLADPSAQATASSAPQFVSDEAPRLVSELSASGDSQVPQITTGADFDVGQGSPSVGSVRRRKNNNGLLWTVVGGLGGGICAIVFCFFLLKGSGLFKTGELDEKEDVPSTQISDEGDNGVEPSDDNEVGPKDPPWQSPLVDESSETNSPNDTGEDPGASKDPEGSKDPDGSVDPIGPTDTGGGQDPKETEGTGGSDSDGSDSGGNSRAAEIQSRLDRLMDRYQAHIDDPTGEPERKSLRSESAGVVAQFPQLNLVDRIEEKFPADSDTAISRENPDVPTDVERPDLSLPKFYSAIAPNVVKKDVPDTDAIREQQKLIESLYESEFKAAKDDVAVAHNLAKQLVSQASASTDSPAQIYVMFQKAIELARKIGDGESAAMGFLGLRDQFNVPESWDEIHSTIDTINRKVKNESQAKVFYRGVDQLSRRAFTEGNFQEAKFLAGKGFSIARKQDHEMAQEHYERLRGYFGELEGLNEYANQEPDVNSDDSPTLVGQGKFLVYLKQDKEGFDYWAKSENESLSSLAKLEFDFAENPQPQSQFELGKAWYEKSKTYETFEDHFGMARAASLLRPVLAQLKGIERTVAAHYVDRIDETYAPIFADDTTIGVFPNALKRDKVFYFRGEDGAVQALVPSGIYVQFDNSGSAGIYFEAGENSNVKSAKLSYSSLLGGVLLVKDREYRISIHATKHPMELGLEIFDSRGRLSKPLMFNQSSTPSDLPERFSK